ncbi:hypothetical protein ACT2CI_00125 [Candidatus Vidania fulgoroideorum]
MKNIKIKSFNNLEKYIILKKKKKILVFTVNKNINLNIIELFMALYALKKKKKLVLKYFPFCRQHREKKNVCNSFMFMIYILKKLKVKKIYTFDIHYDPKIKIIKNIKTYDIIEKIIKKKKIDYLVFPDIGSFKRFNKLKKYKHIIFIKKRIKGKIKNKCIKKIKKKKKYLIVDDIIDTGETINKCLSKIRKKSKKLYVYCTHIFLKKEINVKKIFTTDSVETKLKKVKVFSLNKYIKKI